jgi:hypothetical protein
MPQGIESDWVIQDIEGMVDLVFTPQEQIHSKLTLVAAKAEYATPLGLYNGTLLDTAGNPITIHNQWGLGERLNLRI